MASPEAIERRRERDRLRKRELRKHKARRKIKTPAEQSAALALLPPAVGPGRKFFLGVLMPEKSKAELRAMLADAMLNTARL